MLVAIIVFIFANTRTTKAISAIGGAIALTFLVADQLWLWRDYSRLQRAYAEGRYSVLQGRIEDFGPGSGAGNIPQTFSVGAHRFAVSPANNTAAFRGFHPAMRAQIEGRCARLWTTDRHDILRLELVSSEVECKYDAT